MQKQRIAIVLGGQGFIGINTVIKLKQLEYWVRCVDIKKNEFIESPADENIFCDLRNPFEASKVLFSPKQISLNDDVNSFDVCFQYAAEMGGMGFLATGENDSAIMHDSALINLNVVNYASLFKVKKIFWSSSACAYSEKFQMDTYNISLSEDMVWHSRPESAYGIEKLFSESLYDSFYRNKGLNIRVARFHNVFGEFTTYDGIRAKAPASLCRKVAMASDGDEIEVWGDGQAVRSFLYVNECIEGVLRLLESDFTYPINIGSAEEIKINDLAQMVIDISGKNLTINNVEGVQGVRGRNSNNTLIQQVLGWQPTASLRSGMEKLFAWVNSEVQKQNK